MRGGHPGVGDLPAGDGRVIRVRAQAEDFDSGAELAALEALGGGAVASFTGIVRADGGLVELMLEYYPAMTEPAMHAIAEEACRRWPLLAITVIHRYGPLAPGSRIVFVGTVSRHRAAALEACAFLIDWLKTKAPFWKLEENDAGASWVAAKDSDDDAASTTNLLQLARRLHDEHVKEGADKRDALIAEGHATAARIVAEAETKQRNEMARLNQEKAAVEHRIDELRTFEKDYRSGLKSYIEEQLGNLTSSSVDAVCPAAIAWS